MAAIITRSVSLAADLLNSELAIPGRCLAVLQAPPEGVTLRVGGSDANPLPVRRGDVLDLSDPFTKVFITAAAQDDTANQTLVLGAFDSPDRAHLVADERFRGALPMELVPLNGANLTEFNAGWVTVPPEARSMMVHVWNGDTSAAELSVYLGTDAVGGAVWEDVVMDFISADAYARMAWGPGVGVPYFGGLAMPNLLRAFVPLPLPPRIQVRATWEDAGAGNLGSVRIYFSR